MDMTTRLSSLESQVSSLRQERSRLIADLEVERTKCELVEETRAKSVSHSLQLQQIEQSSLLDEKKNWL